jgi:UDP-glucose 6-dehydrogenase
VSHKHIAICCTVLPGYIANVARDLLKDAEGCTLSYNPSFIAQGNVMQGLLRPDMVHIDWALRTLKKIT